MDTTLGKRIAVLRREKGLTQDELAQKLGVSSQAVSKWENDQTCPDILLLPQLAQILGVSVDELLSGKKDEQKTVRMLPESERKDIKDMMLRIVVTTKDEDKVRINLPLGLVEVAIESGIAIPQIAGNDALKNLDLNAIMNMVKQGVIGNLVEVESPDGDSVRIFVE